MSSCEVSLAGVPAGTPAGAPGTAELRWSRAIGGVTGLAALAHLPLAVAHLGVSLWLAVALALMSLLCLPCAGKLIRDPGRSTWTMVVVLGSVMIALHLLLMSLPAGPSAARMPMDAMAGMHAGPATAGGAQWWLGGPALSVVTALTAIQVLGGLALLVRSGRASRQRVRARTAR